MPSHLYIHVPFCDGKCHYCGFYSVVAAPSLTALYSGLPACELDRLLETQPSVQNDPVRTVYIGGGTPAMVGSDGLKRLADTVSTRLSFNAVEEWTVELNPATVTPVLLKTLATIGVNRISIGVQSFNDAVLAQIGRRHTAAAATRAIRMAQDAGFSNTGIDLIAGLPGVTQGMWQTTLEHAASLGLRHLSVYALSVEPGTRLAAQVAEGLVLPDDEAQLATLSQAEQFLGLSGFERYEVSNYALPGYACKHNVGIWRGNDYIGLGPAAASRLGRLRWTNSEDVSDYIESLTHQRALSDAKEMRSEMDDAVERVIFALRLSEGIDPFATAQRFPILKDRATLWERRLEGLAHQGIIERIGRRWRLSSRGREVCDAVLRELS